MECTTLLWTIRCTHTHTHTHTYVLTAVCLVCQVVMFDWDKASHTTSHTWSHTHLALTRSHNHTHLFPSYTPPFPVRPRQTTQYSSRPVSPPFCESQVALFPRPRLVISASPPQPWHCDSQVILSSCKFSLIFSVQRSGHTWLFIFSLV